MFCVAGVAPRGRIGEWKGAKAMDGPPPDFRLLKFSSDRYPQDDRLDSWRSILARKLLALEVEPLSDAPFRAHAALRLLPGLRFGSGVFGASINRRPRAIANADNDDFAIVVNLEGTLSASQRGREFTLNEGDAYLMACSESGVYARNMRGRVLCARFPSEVLAPLAHNLYDQVARPIMCKSDALRLLVSYFRVLEDNQALGTPELRRLVVKHSHELIRLVLNPSRDQAAACRDGLGAGRLHAIKTHVMEHIGRQDLSVANVAAAHRLSIRQVQRLFENEGTTFSEFVLTERLGKIHDALSDPKRARLSISELAFDNGFSDVSYFNHAFRRRYRATPSDVRNGGVVGFRDSA